MAASPARGQLVYYLFSPQFTSAFTAAYCSIVHFTRRLILVGVEFKIPRIGTRDNSGVFWLMFKTLRSNYFVSGISSAGPVAEG